MEKEKLKELILEYKEILCPNKTCPANGSRRDQPLSPSARNRNHNRDLQALKDVRNEIKAKHLTVITYDEEETIASSSIGHGEIKIIPIQK